MLWIIYFEFFIIYHNVAIETGRKGIISLSEEFFLFYLFVLLVGFWGSKYVYMEYDFAESTTFASRIAIKMKKPYSVKVFPLFLFFFHSSSSYFMLKPIFPLHPDM